MKRKSLLLKASMMLAFGYVCISNIHSVITNKGYLSVTDLESLTENIAIAACENIPSKNNGDCNENESSISCDQSDFWHDCYR